MLFLEDSHGRLGSSADLTFRNTDWILHRACGAVVDLEGWDFRFLLLFLLWLTVVLIGIIDFLDLLRLEWVPAINNYHQVAFVNYQVLLRFQDQGLVRSEDLFSLLHEPLMREFLGHSFERQRYNLL
jgi:hypothetical protein